MVTNRARGEFKNQNDPWEKLIQAGLVSKNVSAIDFLQNRVMRIAFFTHNKRQISYIYISFFYIIK